MSLNLTIGIPFVLDILGSKPIIDFTLYILHCNILN